MTGISRYERAVLALTAIFLLFVGGCFLVSQNTARPFTVTTARTEGADSAGTEREKTTPDSLLEGEIIDLNRADEYDLARLPGIGEKRAAAIVADRAANGPFADVDDLDRVEGIGPATLEGLRDYACAKSGGE